MNSNGRQANDLTPVPAEVIDLKAVIPLSSILNRLRSTFLNWTVIQSIQIKEQRQTISGKQQKEETSIFIELCTRQLFVLTNVTHEG